jgi:hypothetical protein
VGEQSHPDTDAGEDQHPRQGHAPAVVLAAVRDEDGEVRDLQGPAGGHRADRDRPGRRAGADQHDESGGQEVPGGQRGVVDVGPEDEPDGELHGGAEDDEAPVAQPVAPRGLAHPHIGHRRMKAAMAEDVAVYRPHVIPVSA